MSARLVAAALAAGLLVPMTAHAQTEPAATTQAAPDPARLAAAEKVVGRLVPDGVYKRMLGDNFGAMMNAAMDSVGNMPLQQVVQLTGIDSEEAAKLGEGTLREVLEIYDPAWQKRTTATTTAFSGMMGRIAAQVEPVIRKALSRAYAREFALAELQEMDRFFASPAGAHYAAKSLEITMDPEMIKAMTEIMPQMMGQMPDMAKEMEAVEKALPKQRSYAELSPAEQKRVAELLGVDAATLEGAAPDGDDADTAADAIEATP